MCENPSPQDRLKLNKQGVKAHNRPLYRKMLKPTLLILIGGLGVYFLAYQEWGQSLWINAPFLLALLFGILWLGSLIDQTKTVMDFEDDPSLPPVNDKMLEGLSSYPLIPVSIGLIIAQHFSRNYEETWTLWLGSGAIALVMATLALALILKLFPGLKQVNEKRINALARLYILLVLSSLLLIHLGLYVAMEQKATATTHTYIAKKKKTATYLYVNNDWDEVRPPHAAQVETGDSISVERVGLFGVLHYFRKYQNLSHQR